VASARGVLLAEGAALGDALLGDEGRAVLVPGLGLPGLGHALEHGVVLAQGGQVGFDLGHRHPGGGGHLGDMGGLEGPGGQSGEKGEHQGASREG
jgi:hypothetical protein